MDFNQKVRERRIAEGIAHEIQRQLGPIAPEALAAHGDLVCNIFADGFDSNKVVAEDEGARILKLVPAMLAKLNLEFAELNAKLDAAVAATVNDKATP